MEPLVGMTNRGPARIELNIDDGLPDVLTRIKATHGDEVVIAIPEQSGLFLTAAEFRQLRATTDQVRVSVVLETNDPLREQLASMFGFERIPHFTEDEQNVAEEHPSWPTAEKRLPKVRSRIPAADDLTTSKPWREEAVEASRGFAVPPKPVARPEYALEPRTGAIAKQEPDARAKMRPSTIISLVAIFVAILFVAAVLSIVLRTGEVTIRTQRQPIAMDLVVGYSTDGSTVPGATITLPATQTEFAVPLVTTAKATGILADKSGFASGTVQLRNISGASLSLPVGSRMQMSDGIVYVTTAEVQIPKGDPDEPGKAEVAVQAEAPGSIANREPGTLTGQLTDAPGVYFANLDGPLTGGNDITFAVVTQEDLAAAEQKARADLRALASSWQLPDGQVVIPSTVSQVGETSVALNRVAGEQADTIDISAQGTFTALTIDPNNLPDDLQDQLRKQLETAVPPGYRLTDDPIAFSKPVEQQAGAGTLAVSASIDAAQELTPERVEEIRSAVEGDSIDEARAALAPISDIQVVDIVVRPALFVKELPDADKIEVTDE